MFFSLETLEQKSHLDGLCCVSFFFGLINDLLLPWFSRLLGPSWPRGWHWYPLRNPPEKLMRLEDFLPRERQQRHDGPAVRRVHVNAAGCQDGFGPRPWTWMVGKRRTTIQNDLGLHRNPPCSNLAEVWHYKPSTEILVSDECTSDSVLALVGLTTYGSTRKCISLQAKLRVLQLGRNKLTLSCSKFKLNVGRWVDEFPKVGFPWISGVNSLSFREGTS